MYSKRYAGPNATDKDRIEKVLNLMKDVEEYKRTAKIKCDICYIDKDAKKHFFEGVCNVKIAREPIKVLHKFHKKKKIRLVIEEKL